MTKSNPHTKTNLILKNKTIAIGVTGSIAVYKTCEIASRLVKLGADVHIVMTLSAREFVTPLTFETLTKNKVIVEMFNEDREWEVEHISLAKKADLFLVAPATANIIGKFALGIADDFLSTTLMAVNSPILIAPAMNTNMFFSPSYRKNEKTLRDRGVIFIEADEGLLACGDSGKGRLAKVDDIVDAVVKVLKPKQDFLNKRVLITLGATREYIDPIRFISNKSSGKMGLALYSAFIDRGAEVTLIAGQVSVNLPDSAIRVETTKQMYNAVINTEEKYDYYVLSAAVSDYSPLKMQKNKIKDREIVLKLEKNPDIALSLSKQRVNSDSKLIIFAAETENLVENAKNKLNRKSADMVVANDITKEGAGFDIDTNIVTIITKDSEKPFNIMKKSQLSHIILDEILCLQK